MNMLTRLILAGSQVLFALVVVPQAGATRETAIHIEHVAASTVVYRPVQGAFTQHPQVISETIAYATRTFPRNFTHGSAVFGIYPVDPDSVTVPSALEWEIGAVLTPGPDVDAAMTS